MTPSEGNAVRFRMSVPFVTHFSVYFLAPLPPPVPILMCDVLFLNLNVPPSALPCQSYFSLSIPSGFAALYVSANVLVSTTVEPTSAIAPFRFISVPNATALILKGSFLSFTGTLIGAETLFARSIGVMTISPMPSAKPFTLISPFHVTKLASPLPTSVCTPLGNSKTTSVAEGSSYFTLTFSTPAPTSYAAPDTHTLPLVSGFKYSMGL